ncbi:MAG: tetratricopeptide repeat protein [Candidatus Fimousia sp.]
MEQILQTVRIFYTKDYNVDVLYIKEFLQIIGCMTCSQIKKIGQELTPEERKQKYDINLFYGIDYGSAESKIQNDIYIDKNTIMRLKSEDQILEKVIQKIWPVEKNPLVNEELNKIREGYKGIFSCLYNYMNIGFINEYSPVNNNGEEAIQLKKEVCEATYKAFLNCYNKLYDYKKNDARRVFSVYYEYIMLNLKFRINEIKKINQEEVVFDIDIMLNDAKNIMEKNQDFMIIYYRVAAICRSDVRYKWNAEAYYNEMIKKLNNRYRFPSTLRSIFYYNMGRYYEKNIHDMEKANDCYKKSAEDNPKAYRTQFKLAKIKEENKNYDGMIDILNRIIQIVVDDYSYEQLMPREQIYIFKVYRLMGNAFYEKGELQYAEQAYRKAVEISRAISNYFEKNSSDIDKKFFRLLQICMSPDSIYRKLINCVSKEGDSEKYREYLSYC